MHQNRSFPQEHFRNILQSSPPVAECFISPQLRYMIGTEHMAALKVSYLMLHNIIFPTVIH